MKYDLVLYIDTSAKNDLPHRALSLGLDALLETLKSCEGVLWLNASAWIFDLVTSREIYDQVLSEAKQSEVQLMTIELPDGLVYNLVHEYPMGPKAEVDKRIAHFFSSKT